MVFLFRLHSFRPMIFIMLMMFAACSDSRQLDSQEDITEKKKEVISEFTCDQLPTSFSSYREAVSMVEAATYPVFESANCSGSSWIRSANYYSCDGRFGYLIVGTDKQRYIHSNVPLNVWEGFFYVNSHGSYYSRHIKGNYQLR